MDKNSFAERITALRQVEHLSREEVAKKLGCTASAVGNYENAYRIPDYDTLIALADLYCTSTDYLLGRTDILSMEIDRQFVCEYTGLSEDAISKIKNYSHKVTTKNREHHIYSYLPIISYLLSSKQFSVILSNINLYTNSDKRLTEIGKVIDSITSPLNDKEEIEAYDNLSKEIDNAYRDKICAIFEIQEAIKKFTQDCSANGICAEHTIEKIDDDVIIVNDETLNESIDDYDEFFPDDDYEEIFPEDDNE